LRQKRRERPDRRETVAVSLGLGIFGLQNREGKVTETTTNMREVTARRLAMLELEYEPLPVIGKQPPLPGWSTVAINHALVGAWELTHRSAVSTGARCGRLVVLGVGLRDEAAADAVEALVRSRFGNGAKKLLRRIGQHPKRAFMFYTAAPFAKMQQVMDPPDDSPEPRDNKQPKIEILAKGQHVVVDGVHPDTHQPYTWTGGEPWTVHIGDLPELSEAAARTLLNDAVEVLIARKWRRKESAQRDAGGAQADADDAAAGDVPLMVRLATKLWGPARAAGRSEWRFGAKGSKHVDASAKQWFDFEAWRGGTMRDLMRMVEET